MRQGNDGPLITVKSPDVVTGERGCNPPRATDFFNTTMVPTGAKR
jgi:hypothetical protein